MIKGQKVKKPFLASVPQLPVHNLAALIICSRTGLPNLFEPVVYFGILTQDDGHSHKMAATEGKANHKMSGSKVIYRSNSNSD